MSGMFQRLLVRYHDSDYIIQLKSQFMLRVCIAGIVIIPPITIYNIYLSITKEVFGHAIYWPIIVPLLFIFFIYLIAGLLIIKGRFSLGAHLFFIASQVLIWSIILLDKSGPIERLDTIAILIAILAMSPLIIKQRPLLIPIYSALTILVSVIFARFFSADMNLTQSQVVDFLGDIGIASVVVAIMAYNLFSINRAALVRSEESRKMLATVNEELTATNEELEETNEELSAAMEELTATNEEFETQNRELVESQQIISDSLEEKNVLLKEIHHRVKNNMQIISSLLNMQAQNIQDPPIRQIIHDAISRIHSMALIHEKIYQAGNFTRIDMAAYITELLDDIILLSAKSSNDIQATTSLEPVHLAIGQAIPCGILINEILTNSIKHGCTDTGCCRIDLTMSNRDGIFSMIISDSGPGLEKEMVDNGTMNTMGIQLINALIKQLNADLNVSVNKGTTFTILFKIKLQ